MNRDALSTRSQRVIVLGLGNLLLRDDAAGVVALSQLGRAVRPDPRVDLVDGGTLGLALLDFIDPDSTLILVDAVAADAAPGTVMVLEGADVAAAAAGKLSPHQVGVADLLAAAEHLGRTPERTVLVGVVPLKIELEIGLTAPVAAAIGAMVTAIILEVARCGIELQPARDRADNAELELSSALGL